LPHLKTAHEKYRNDPDVAFILVSLDEDSKRLQRYLDEAKFPFPVARLAFEQAGRLMGIDNVPATFYVDRDGLVGYQVTGSESHGDSPTRVSWYIEQLKRMGLRLRPGVCHDSRRFLPAEGDRRSECEPPPDSDRNRAREKTSMIPSPQET
jgi:hypothetical protein